MQRPDTEETIFWITGNKMILSDAYLNENVLNRFFEKHRLTGICPLDSLLDLIDAVERYLSEERHNEGNLTDHQMQLMRDMLAWSEIES